MLVSSGLIVNQVLTISRGLNYSFGPYTVRFHTPAFHLHASHSPAPPRLTRPHTSMPYTPPHLHALHSPTPPRLTLPHTSVPHSPPHLRASHSPTPPRLTHPHTSTRYPQVLLGLKDCRVDVVQATLHALGDLVPLVGIEAVLGTSSEQLFTDSKPRVSGRGTVGYNPPHV